MMRRTLRRGLSAALLLALIPAIAFAYAEYNRSSDDQTVGGVVQMWVDGSGKAREASASNPMPVTTVSASSGSSTPTAGTASAIVTGGTAVTLITGPVTGCVVTNPLAAADQNIATAEVAYVNPVTTATANGRGTNTALQPGQPWRCPPGMTTNLSAIAATTAHAFSVVKW